MDHSQQGTQSDMARNCQVKAEIGICNPSSEGDRGVSKYRSVDGGWWMVDCTLGCGVESCWRMDDAGCRMQDGQFAGTCKCNWWLLRLKLEAATRKWKVERGFLLASLLVLLVVASTPYSVSAHRQPSERLGYYRTQHNPLFPFWYSVRTVRCSVFTTVQEFLWLFLFFVSSRQCLHPSITTITTTTTTTL